MKSETSNAHNALVPSSDSPSAKAILDEVANFPFSLDPSPLTLSSALYTPSTGRTFSSDLLAIRTTGHLIITPRLILLGKAVPTGLSDYSDPWARYEESTCDAWLVWLAAGDLNECLRHIPYPKKYIGFARQDRLRWYRYDELTKKLGRRVNGSVQVG